MIDRELYLPTSWTTDPQRCAAAGIPHDIEFATKPALAKTMIGRALDAGIPARWAAGDEVYGADPGLRAEAQTGLDLPVQALHGSSPSASITHCGRSIAAWVPNSSRRSSPAAAWRSEPRPPLLRYIRWYQIGERAHRWSTLPPQRFRQPRVQRRRWCGRVIEPAGADRLGQLPPGRAPPAPRGAGSHPPTTPPDLPSAPDPLDPHPIGDQLIQGL